MFARLKLEAFRFRGGLQSSFQNRPYLVLALMVSASLLVFVSYSIYRYLALQTNFFDLGLNSNWIWRADNGYDPVAALIFPSTPGHINHISPILILVAALYGILPDPRTLLVLQASLLALAAVPLYLLAVRETQNSLAALVVSGLYLVNPGLHGIVRYDFHVESFIPLLAFLIYYSYIRRGTRLFYLSTILFLSTMEYSAVLGLGIGIYLWLRKKRLDGRILTLLASSFALLAIIAVSTVGAAFQSVGWPANWLAIQFLGNSHSQTGSYIEWMHALWNNPGILVSSLQFDAVGKLTYLLVVAAPFWLLAKRSALRMIPAAPWLAIVLMSTKFSFININFQYTAFVIPFVYVAAIPLLATVMRRRKLLLGIVVMSICIMLLYSSISSVASVQEWPQPSPLVSKVSSLNALMPLNATILTQTDIYPLLSNRPYVIVNYSLPEPPQYILVNTQTQWYNWTNPALGFPLSPSQQLRHFTSEYTYEMVFVDHGLRLYKLEDNSLHYP